MKKIFSLICVLLAICLLTACTTVYVPQENINLNYNNNSGGYCPFWLENDYFVYSDADDNFKYKYFIKDQNQNKMISQKEADSMEKVQAYGNMIYYAVYEETDQGVLDTSYIYQYNRITNTETYIASTHYFETFFVDGQYLYLVASQENFNEYHYITDVISLETREIITQIPDIYVCGMRKGVFTYLKDTKDGFDIFEYHPQTEKTEKIADFPLPITKNITIHPVVNFTSNAIILDATLSQNEVSQILIYNFKEDSLKTIDPPYTVDTIVAYENHAFCSLTDYEDYKTYLYSLNLDTFELLQLGRIGEDKSLFVTSDEDVYLCSNWDGIEIIHYNLDGTKEKVLINSSK